MDIMVDVGFWARWRLLLGRAGTLAKGKYCPISAPQMGHSPIDDSATTLTNMNHPSHALASSTCNSPETNWARSIVSLPWKAGSIDVFF